MAESKFFTAKVVEEKTTMITGLGMENCYLVEGTERALLIDTLTGVGSLKAFVRELTDLPLTVVNTHGHVDHCGSNFEYGECLIHPDDVRLMYQHSDEKMRMGFVMSMQRGRDIVLTDEDVIPSCPIKTFPAYGGDVFDLGGRQIEVIAVPGHTRGTIVLLDRALRIVFSGDACNANTLLIDTGVSIEEYRESLVGFKSFMPAYDKLYGGHGPTFVPASIVDEGIELCSEIIAGTDDADPGNFMNRECLYGKKRVNGFQREDGKICNIAYTKDSILKK